jgi:antitoxin VapB
MAFNIKNDETDELLRRLVAVTGESLTDAVTVSLRERLRRVERAENDDRLRRILDLAAAAHRLPVLAASDADAVLGYDTDGLPT